MIFPRAAMESKAASEAPALKRSCLDTNYSKCIICQEENKHDLVVSPTNSQNMLDSVKERALYGDSYFPEVNRRLQIVTEEELVVSKATWHRICYQQTTNKELIILAKERYEGRKSDLDAPTSAEATNNPTRRSLCPTYEKKNCFFYDEEISKRNPLHKVATLNAGKNPKDAVNLNNNDKLKVRLNEALNPLDAHAIDLLYHKKCWAINISNLL